MLDPRKDKSRGFSPEAIIAQLIFTFCSGGTSLSDAGRLGADPTLGKLLGVDCRGEEVIQQYGWIKYLPGGECERVQTFAVMRFKAKAGGELLWRYAYVVGGGKIQKECLHEPAAAKEVFQTHRFKGAKEQVFHQLLGDMDLHQPPCLNSYANELFYAIGALAYNLLMAVKVLLLKDEHQAWTVRTLIRFWLTVPVKVSSHANRQKARIFVRKASMRWWRLFVDQYYPKRKRGRPPKHSAPIAVEFLGGLAQHSKGVEEIHYVKGRFG